ncbi:hypothetical protein TNCV_3439961 [Trichonephila clavipes]|uniref:Uncharacterized protein n=1 Tax=Trichonephila clavipes TaxID=2585209 RepID=A0A8X6W5N4_TRICX|nr:hypothetical protein TNCV_3439961 [Trichonephila clavipes]
MNKNQSNFTKPIHQSESAFDQYGVRQPPIPHTDERRPVSEITPPLGEAGGGKRPNEDETGERHEVENGRAQEGGRLNSPKTRSRSTNNAVERKMLLFFAAGMKKKGVCKGNLQTTQQA